MIERQGDVGDMLEQAALGDQHRDQQDLDRRADKAAATDLLDREPDCRGQTDQHNHGDDAAERVARPRCGSRG